MSAIDDAETKIYLPYEKQPFHSEGIQGILDSNLLYPDDVTDPDDVIERALFETKTDIDHGSQYVPGVPEEMEGHSADGGFSIKSYVVGTPFDDYLYGTDQGESFVGGGGDDVLTGFGGVDTFYYNS